MVLEAVTSLPEEVIDKLVREAAAGRVPSAERSAALAEAARAGHLDEAIDLAATRLADERTTELTRAQRDGGTVDTAQVQARADRSPAQLAAESFPSTVAYTVQATATAPKDAARSPVRIANPEIPRRRGPAL